MKQHLKTTISALANGAISPAEAVTAVVSTGLARVATQSSDSVGCEGDTPGAESFFWTLWAAVLDAVREGSVDDEASRARVDRAVAFVAAMKALPPDDGSPKWTLWGEAQTWRDLPLLGPTVRENYNGPFQNRLRDANALYISEEGQAAIARAHPTIGADGAPNGDLADVQRSCEAWLLLNLFLARLWRAGAVDWAALYALWALRSGLEDAPSPLPRPSASPVDAYVSLAVEVASLWLQHAAPLVYRCTDVWGPNGRADWPGNRGAPGRGGRRWTGVDGFDAEHARWALWKSVLREVARWCEQVEGEGRMKGWKIGQATEKALEAMEAAEHNADV
ncbi:hypothetical protein PUNSTDRAFT_145514 [Punctularia strigosozonata HHB-11173 SS5]|uniref:uncharacterized protein n=1 Tax=Punctularia strigosozonata (strain HHB-11173) TaxID=741275 RepID=UPI0004417AFD|nr:uncharacterized protein PUNSTDRAFT_145514 [Punctularia strigosozonata HHB-11173 SS5]EIN06205.1 hypothetical protein PUNSTDRAFT_145514 [Punctularia strigosozonata HHB-11173 SS5]